MRKILPVLVMSVLFALVDARSAHAQRESTDLDVCLAIDEDRDTLSPQERLSAVLLLSRQFELAGRRVVLQECPNQWRVSHIALGAHIVVTLSGLGESREGIAAGLSDLPALYSQMVRSLITGRPMTGFNVVDRTNVTVAQAHANRVHTDRYGYARLGYGSILGDRVYGTPALGLGYRAELDTLGIDVSFLNVQSKSSGYGGSGAAAFSLLKLQALYFIRPTANASPYVGGGLSWGGSTFTPPPDDDLTGYSTAWHGSGLQGEVTVGYELPRASTLRIFVEGNAVLPFYRMELERYSPSGGGPATVSRRFAPSVVVSVGLGWQRDRDSRW